MEKDITTNDLIDNCDVFADIANVNLFGGRHRIAPEDLESVPTDSSYKDLEGQHHRLFRDALKKVHGLGGCIGFLGYESQTGINNAMPVRDMGYTYTSYAGQIQKIIARNRERSDSAYSKVLHEGQRLAPVATFVLYFGQERWEKPLSLMDILEIPESEKDFWRDIINDYQIRVIHMADQPEELRKKYRSDFGIIADYLSCRNNPQKGWKQLRRDTRRLVHVEQTLDLLKALSGDRRFERIKESFMESEEKEERDTMCALLDMCEEEGIRKGRIEGRKEGRKEGKAEGRIEGRQEGKAEGILFSIRNLIKNADITLEQAMVVLGIPEEERQGYADRLNK